MTPAPRPPAPASPLPVGFSLQHRQGGFQLRVGHRAGSPRVAVLGPSGSGKSTLLRCVAGLYGDAPGSVSFGGRRVEGVPVEHRRVGYVAQSFGLFPHLTVRQQLLFATDADPASAAHWLAHLRLEGLEDRYPHELSGGQRQRVALAQALCRSPDVLLLDEPFGALDTPVRKELQRELRRLQHETGVATVLVTHDPEEAALLADEVLVIDDGQVLQDGPVRAVYSRPSSPQVARLVGVPNLCGGVVVRSGTVRVAAHGPGPGIELPADTGALAPGTGVLWSVRPEAIELVAPGAPAGVPPGAVAGVVADVADLGWATEALVALGERFAEAEVRARVPGHTVPGVGEPCAVVLPADAISVWAAVHPAAPDGPDGPGTPKGPGTPQGPGTPDGPDTAHAAGTDGDRRHRLERPGRDGFPLSASP